MQRIEVQVVCRSDDCWGRYTSRTGVLPAPCNDAIEPFMELEITIVRRLRSEGRNEREIRPRQVTDIKFVVIAYKPDDPRLAMHSATVLTDVEHVVLTPRNRLRSADVDRRLSIRQIITNQCGFLRWRHNAVQRAAKIL